MATPNYAMHTEYSLPNYPGDDPIVLIKGSFVRPMELSYVPKHVKENPRWVRIFNPTMDVFAYTYYGILPIPRNKFHQI